MIKKAYYQEKISAFVTNDSASILGHLTSQHEFSLDERQRNSWQSQINLLKSWILDFEGNIAFEYSIPRMGKRIDCVLIIRNVVFVIEFKVGSDNFDSASHNQTIDYALDLKNFHSESHEALLAPILVCTEASEKTEQSLIISNDQLTNIFYTNGSKLAKHINDVLKIATGKIIDAEAWFDSIYKPTPTIIEAAQALYRGHNIEEISRSDSGAINLSKTSLKITEIIDDAKLNKKKAICFITGVPGAGKTLAGLNIANAWQDAENSEHAVFLSGNGPLVDILREALARDEVKSAKEKGETLSKTQSLSKAKSFIQNIHHFRDDAITSTNAPIEHVVIFDEAQRAWTEKQASSFMKTKKGVLNFDQSEPEFLISVMDRHKEWGVIICLIGGGQEINKGEAGIKEWFFSLFKSFPDWNIHVSDQLTDYEYTQGNSLMPNNENHRIHIEENLHLSVSIRSFRSENVSAFVKALLDTDIDQARNYYENFKSDYPIVITRDITKAKLWLREKARGTERYGLIASSGGIRLRPYAIQVKNSMKPADWFLNDKNDVRSSYYLEDVATQFDIQGLELDWVCVAWDADLRMIDNNWIHKKFVGSKWTDIRDPTDRNYLKNTYRVLLTRARQGMVIFIPEGSNGDVTRLPAMYDDTYEYLKSLGIQEL